MITNVLDHLYQKQLMTDLDLQFARFMGRLSGPENPELTLAAALVSRLRADGHICLDLATGAGLLPAEGIEGFHLPDPERWIEALTRSPVVGRPGDYYPLILDGTRLYLYRYWGYERKLADILLSRAGGNVNGIDEDLLRKGLARLFPPDPADPPGETDWQMLAACTALTKRLCIISGGPGTGKTFTVAKILALLLEQAQDQPARIALAAPTGKAAARLQEAIREAKSRLPLGDALRSAIPEEASTIHRLLGSRPDSPYFRHGMDNPLPVDAVVVDEASMVDLALMSKLAQAVPPRTRLILLGDKDQLASVEAGAVLGDICDTGNSHGYTEPFREDFRRITGEPIDASGGSDDSGIIGDCIVQLQKSYRFRETSGIRAVSRAVNEGKGDDALSLIKGGDYSDIRWKELPGKDRLIHVIEEWLDRSFSDYVRTADPREAFARFSRFRILCALRESPYGVSALNLLMEQILHRKGIIRREGRWYAGRPVMITRNDYGLRLFNGDVGIALPDPEANRELRVFFPAQDGAFRSFTPLRLPEHETVYAMTVHKSQGSEFDEVLFLMPDRDVPQLLTRELLYTAVTRARERIEIWAHEDIFLSAVNRRITRSSGLREALWGVTKIIC